MKQLQFMVTLDFEGEVTSDEEIMEVQRNIAESLKYTVDTAGLAPEESDTWTKKITVAAQLLPDQYTFIDV